MGITFNFGLSEIEREVRYCAGKYSHANSFVDSQLDSRVNQVSSLGFFSLVKSGVSACETAGKYLITGSLIYPFLDEDLKNRFSNTSLFMLVYNTHASALAMVNCKPLNFVLKYSLLSFNYILLFAMEVLGSSKIEREANIEFIKSTESIPYESFFIEFAKKGALRLEKPFTLLENLFISAEKAMYFSNYLRDSYKEFLESFPESIQKYLPPLHELDYRYLILRAFNYFGAVFESFNRFYNHPCFPYVFFGSSLAIFLYSKFQNKGEDEAFEVLKSRSKCMADFLIYKSNKSTKTPEEVKYLKELSEGIIEHADTLISEIVALPSLGFTKQDAKSILRPLIAASREILQLSI